MKDLNLSRMINIVAAGSIILVGTGCGSKEHRAAKKYCKAQQECNKGDFEDEFSDLNDCIEYYEDLIEDFEDYSNGCGDAFVELGLCAGPAYQKDCDSGDIEDECEDELEDVGEECGLYSYYYYYGY